MGVEHSGKELSAAARIMQSTSKELSTLVADRVLKKCKQTAYKQRLLLLNKYLKIPLANVVRLSAERSEI